jgi:hypothetical protein
MPLFAHVIVSWVGQTTHATTLDVLHEQQQTDKSQDDIKEDSHVQQL